jgi:hypothetical protein
MAGKFRFLKLEDEEFRRRCLTIAQPKTSTIDAEA